jgi:hypothetical protein
MRWKRGDTSIDDDTATIRELPAGGVEEWW